MTEEQVAQYQQSVDTNQELTIQTEDSQDNQITAEVVQADPASPGKKRPHVTHSTLLRATALH